MNEAKVLMRHKVTEQQVSIWHTGDTGEKVLHAEVHLVWDGENKLWPARCSIHLKSGERNDEELMLSVKELDRWIEVLLQAKRLFTEELLKEEIEGE